MTGQNMGNLELMHRSDHKYQPQSLTDFGSIADAPNKQLF